MDFLHTVHAAQSHFPKDASEECEGQVQDRTLNVSRLQQLYVSPSNNEAVGFSTKRSHIIATLNTFVTLNVFSSMCPCQAERKVCLVLLLLSPLL